MRFLFSCLLSVAFVSVANLYGVATQSSQSVENHSVFKINGDPEIFDGGESSGVFDENNNCYTIFNDFESEKIPVCVDSHEDTDADGPHGAVLLSENELQGFVEGSSGYLFSIVDLTAHGFNYILLNIDQEVTGKEGRSFNHITSLKVGDQVASAVVKDASTVDCILVDNNTVVCVIVTERRIHVLILCRENGRWRACQNDSNPLNPT